jgi:hypothetical protein
MKKKLGLVAAAAVILPVAVPAAAMADATTPVDGSTFVQNVPSLGGQQAIFIKGGADIGCGAAEAVSAAWLGIPESVGALEGELAGPNAPAQTSFTTAEYPAPAAACS